jgi:hypothetical protein
MTIRAFSRVCAAATLCAVAATATAATPAFPNQTLAPAPAKPSPVKVEVVATGLDHPWSVAFLPDGRMLVTERKGQLRLVGRDGAVSAPLAGVPVVRAIGSKGLEDIALAPDFARSRTVYLTYLAPNPAHADQTPRAWNNWLHQPDRDSDRAGFDTIAKARLSADGTRLEDLKVVLAAPAMGVARPRTPRCLLSSALAAMSHQLAALFGRGLGGVRAHAAVGVAGAEVRQGLADRARRRRSAARRPSS